MELEKLKGKLHKEKWKKMPYVSTSESIEKTLNLPGSGSLSNKWFGKWSFSIEGYAFLFSDGIKFFMEARDMSYIREKSEDWMVCMESETEDLLDVIFSQLIALESTINLEINNDGGTLKLTGHLETLPYKWIFYLSSLDADMIEQYWTNPIAVNLEYLNEKVEALQNELKRKSRLLEQYIPNEGCYTLKTSIENECLHKAIQNIKESGIASTFCDRILACDMESAQRLNEQCVTSDLISNKSKRNSKVKKKNIVKGVQMLDNDSQLDASEHENIRELEIRENINKIVYGSSSVVEENRLPKKKKLNL